MTLYRRVCLTRRGQWQQEGDHFFDAESERASGLQRADGKYLIESLNKINDKVFGNNAKKQNRIKTDRDTDVITGSA